MPVSVLPFVVFGNTGEREREREREKQSPKFVCVFLGVDHE